MIARTHRFHGYNALRFVYKQGRTVKLPMCSLRYIENPKRDNYRLAIVVSKKQSKSAVVRNRIRRRLYEAGRELLPADRSVDMVITVFSNEMREMSRKDINNIFSQILQITAAGKGA